jgi:hypothetical protein
MEQKGTLIIGARVMVWHMPLAAPMILNIIDLTVIVEFIGGQKERSLLSL